VLEHVPHGDDIHRLIESDEILEPAVLHVDAEVLAPVVRELWRRFHTERVEAGVAGSADERARRGTDIQQTFRPRYDLQHPAQPRLRVAHAISSQALVHVLLALLVFAALVDRPRRVMI